MARPNHVTDTLHDGLTSAPKPHHTRGLTRRRADTFRCHPSTPTADRERDGTMMKTHASWIPMRLRRRSRIRAMVVFLTSRYG